MRDGYVDVPVTSRAAEAELERQRARRRAATLQQSVEAFALRAVGGGLAGEPQGSDERTPDPAA